MPPRNALVALVVIVALVVWGLATRPAPAQLAPSTPSLEQRVANLEQWQRNHDFLEYQRESRNSVPDPLRRP